MAQTAEELPKLTYFGINARAFLIRALLRHAGVRFTDVQISFAQFKEAKGPNGFNPDIPLGQLPTLTLPNGLVLVQSGPMYAWAAKKAKLYGNTDEDQLIIDSVVETCGEVLSKIPQQSDKEEKKRLRQDFAHEVIPKYLLYLANVLEKSGGPFVLGKTFSLADLVIWKLGDSFASTDYDYVTWDDTFAKHPILIAHFNAVKDNPIVTSEFARQAAAVALKKQ